MNDLSRLVGADIVGRTGGAVSLAVGMASILSGIPGMKDLMPYWYNFALMFEALFILTTVDAGTRVARFLIQELGGKIYKPLSKTGWLPGNIASSFLVVCAWGYLIKSGNISSIWPMFGVANQLLAAVAFGIGTVVIVKAGKARYAWVTLLPMALMFTTTFSASWELLIIFLEKASHAATHAEALTFKIDALLVFLMVVLAGTVLIDTSYRLYEYLKDRWPATNEAD